MCFNYRAGSYSRCGQNENYRGARFSKFMNGRAVSASVGCLYPHSGAGDMHSSSSGLNPVWVVNKIRQLRWDM